MASTVCLLFISGLVLVSLVLCDVCQDLDSSACAILAATPDFCTTSPTSTSYCQKTCGHCGLTCYHCPAGPVLDHRDCNTTQTCSTGQSCVIRSYHAADGHYEHIMMCDDQGSCDGSMFGFGVSNLVGRRRDSQISLHCCKTDLCNIPVYATTSPKPATATTLPPIQSCVSDIVFVVDESSSIGYQSFKLVMTLIKDIIARIDIGIHSAQVALMIYDMNPHPQWMLHDFTSKASLLRAFNYMPYHNGTSRTDLALQYVRETMLQHSEGDRRDAKNVVIVVTDGQSTRHAPAIQEAKLLKDTGAKVVVVGVQHVDQTELVDIASPYEAIHLLDLHHTANATATIIQHIC